MAITKGEFTPSRELPAQATRRRIISRRKLIFWSGLVLPVLAVLAVGASLAEDGIVREPNIVYAEPDGKPLHLDFMRPEGPGPFPLVICVHGGGWRAGSRADYKAFQTNMAKQGIATASVQYRLAPAAKFPAQTDDVRNALNFVLADPQRFRADPRRILWMGGSAGGHLALLVGLEKSEAYTTRLIVNVAGPTDLRTFQSLPSGDDALKKHVSRDSSELLIDLLGSADRTADIYREASPIEHVRADSPRIVTYHGEKDDIVPISQADSLHAKLRELKVPERLFKAKSGGHNIGAWDKDELLASMLDMAKEIQTAIKID